METVAQNFESSRMGIGASYGRPVKTHGKRQSEGILLASAASRRDGTSAASSELTSLPHPCSTTPPLFFDIQKKPAFFNTSVLFLG